VSILPQAYFVERVGGGDVDVSVMVHPGASPATYEPTPGQMEQLAGADIYFRIGAPFENVWMDKIMAAHPDLTVVDTRRGITLRTMEAGRQEGSEHEGHRGKSGKDPHIWMNPRLAKVQARTICDALSEADAGHRADYESNLAAFQTELDALDSYVRDRLARLSARRFMVFHPAFGYFADAYDLQQVPIEVEGKEPGARALAALIERAREEGIKVIFVQAQFGRRSAEAVAEAIGGSVLAVDPLARDYVQNMKKMADAFAEAMR